MFTFIFSKPLQNQFYVIASALQSKAETLPNPTDLTSMMRKPSSFRSQNPERWNQQLSRKGISRKGNQETRKPGNQRSPHPKGHPGPKDQNRESRRPGSLKHAPRIRNSEEKPRQITKIIAHAHRLHSNSSSPHHWTPTERLGPPRPVRMASRFFVLNQGTSAGCRHRRRRRHLSLSHSLVSVFFKIISSYSE